MVACRDRDDPKTHSAQSSPCCTLLRNLIREASNVWTHLAIDFKRLALNTVLHIPTHTHTHTPLSHIVAFYRQITSSQNHPQFDGYDIYFLPDSTVRSTQKHITISKDIAKQDKDTWFSYNPTKHHYASTRLPPRTADTHHVGGHGTTACRRKSSSSSSSRSDALQVHFRHNLVLLCRQ